MPRERKQVARFDPSPEVVASWNNTSGKLRRRIDHEARVRHGLVAPGAAVVPIAAATCGKAPRASPKRAAPITAMSPLGSKAGKIAGCDAKKQVPAAGRKRPRRDARTPADVRSPPLTELRAGGGGLADAIEGADEGAGHNVAAAVSGGVMVPRDSGHSDATESHAEGGQKSSGADGVLENGAAGAAGPDACSAPCGDGTGVNRTPEAPLEIRDSGGGGGGGDGDGDGGCGTSEQPAGLGSSRGSSCSKDEEAQKGGAASNGHTTSLTESSNNMTDDSDSESAFSSCSRADPGPRPGLDIPWHEPKGSLSISEVARAEIRVAAALAAGAASPPSISASDTDSEDSSDRTPIPQTDHNLDSENPDPSPGNAEDSVVENSSQGQDGCTRASDVEQAGKASPDTEAQSTGARKETEVKPEPAETPDCPPPPPRNVVRLRLARSQLPARLAGPCSEFRTCLETILPEDRLGVGLDGGDFGSDGCASAAVSVLGLTEGDEVDSNTWLTSGLIDLIMAKFARTYLDVHFMSTDFAAFSLRGWDGAGNQASSSSCSGGSRVSNGRGGASVDPREVGRAAAQALEDPATQFQDILGRPVVYAEKRPVVFFTNVNNMHWNLLRVQHEPVPELQLFEPMGKPQRRQGASRAQASGSDGRSGVPGAQRTNGFRCVPKDVYRWLDAVWPIRKVEEEEAESGSSSVRGANGKRGRAAAQADGKGGAGQAPRKRSRAMKRPQESWTSRSYSAITSQQQTTGFDCGVAALLYAEKCGQGQMREDIDTWTNQKDITEYRVVLQRYQREALRSIIPAGGADATAGGDRS